jgi:hypothetical protein
MNLSPYGRNVTLIELSIVLRSLSVLWTFGLLRCACTTPQSATRLEQNTAMRLKLWVIGYWRLAMGYWLLAIGYWLLVIGNWLWGIGYWIWATLPLSVPLHFTLYALH